MTPPRTLARVTTPSRHAAGQYATTTAKLVARMALHAYGTNRQSWWSWLRMRLPRHGSVLEVGAGTGELWRRIDRGASVRDLVLADFSPVMCARLREVPGARVVRCDAAGLPFPAGAFDTLIANHMLYHLDDPDVALREFARVLRPGGRLAIATNGRDHMSELEALAPAVGRPDLGREAPLSDFTAETGRAYVARHFADVTVERYHCDLAVPTPEPIIAYLASLADPPLSETETRAAYEVVRERIDAGGAFPIGKHTVLISAVRW